jgi:hypothetical protein
MFVTYRMPTAGFDFLIVLGFSALFWGVRIGESFISLILLFSDSIFRWASAWIILSPYFPKIVVLLRPPLWSSGQFLATNPEVPGSIPGATRFSEEVVGLEQGPLRKMILELLNCTSVVSLYRRSIHVTIRLVTYHMFTIGASVDTAFGLGFGFGFGFDVNFDNILESEPIASIMASLAQYSICSCASAVIISSSLWCLTTVCIALHSLRQTVVRKRTIPTELPPLIGEISVNFCG